MAKMSVKARKLQQDFEKCKFTFFTIGLLESPSGFPKFKMNFNEGGRNMLGKLTTASLATAVAASLSMGVSAQQEWNHEQQQAQQERELLEARANYQQNRHEKDFSDKTIAEVLDNKDRFSKFNAALERAGMDDRLDNEDGNYTVFAPTNEAIDRLPEGTWDEWTNGDREQLRDVLSYHIVEDRHGSRDFSQQQTNASTLNGGDLRISNAQGNVRVNHASVSHADIEAENGYIHGIDTVLTDNQQNQRRMTGEE